MSATDIKPLVDIPRSEAVRLLVSRDVGRLVYTRRALPAITPVNYAVRENAVWIWTASTSSLAQAVRGAVVAFEVDEIDGETRSGWSVVVLGVAELVVTPHEIELARELGPEPWVAGRKEHLIRIPLREVTGRRVGAAPSSPDDPLARAAL